MTSSSTGSARVARRARRRCWSARASRRCSSSDGKCIGHVFDLRCDTGGEETQSHEGEDLILNPPRCEVREIIYGRRGWLATIGLTRPTTHAIPWSAAARIQDRQVVLHRGAAASHS
jgi:hypothetical protein